MYSCPVGAKLSKNEIAAIRRYTKLAVSYNYAVACSDKKMPKSWFIPTFIKSCCGSFVPTKKQRYAKVFLTLIAVAFTESNQPVLRSRHQRMADAAPHHFRTKTVTRILERQ